MNGFSMDVNAKCPFYRRCERCKHYSSCKNYDYCHGCPMKLDYVECSCMTIKMNTPCKYFEEVKDNA